MKTKVFVCIWFEPSYNSTMSVETLETFHDENRGFDNEIVEKVEKMELKEVAKFDGGDLVVIRVDEDMDYNFKNGGN